MRTDHEPADIRYLTGFRGEDSYAIVASRQLAIVSDFRFAEELERLDRVKVVMRSGSIARDGRHLDRLGLGRLVCRVST